MNDGNHAIPLLVIYFLPTLIAAVRAHMNGVSILVVNLFFGWTIVGWIIALAWCFSSNTKRLYKKKKEE